jgi:hypothetical protein
MAEGSLNMAGGWLYEVLPSEARFLAVVLSVAK